MCDLPLEHGQQLTRSYTLEVFLPLSEVANRQYLSLLGERLDANLSLLWDLARFEHSQVMCVHVSDYQGEPEQADMGISQKKRNWKLLMAEGAEP